MPNNNIIKMKKSKQKIQQDDQIQQMDEIGQMLKVIYVSLWEQRQYNKMLKIYKQRQLKQSQSDSQFNVEGKLLEDIIERINQLKGENIGLRRNSQLTLNKQQKIVTTNNTIIHSPSQYCFIKKSTYNTQNDYNSQLRLKQELITKLQNKINKLEDKISRLQNELIQYKQQSVNLHRLNESKYSKISELKRQIQQQETVIEQQVSVIEQLEKTLNQTIILDQSTSSPYQDQRNNNNIVLDGLQLQSQNENNILQRQSQYSQMIIMMKQQGRRNAWRQLIEQMQHQISTTITLISTNQRRHHDHQVLQNSIKNNNNKIGIVSAPVDNYNNNNDGIQQLQLSFTHMCQQIQLNPPQQQQQQISAIITHHQFQAQQPSQINNLLSEFNSNDNINLPQQQQQYSINYEHSFLSNNNNKYLKTIQTMTLQLTQAYQQINLLQSRLQLTYQHSQKQHSCTTTKSIYPQSIMATSFKQINKNKKNKAFYFNLSFWK